MRGAPARLRVAGTAGAAAITLLTACGSDAGPTASATSASLLRVGSPQFASSPGQGMRQVAQNWTVELLATLTPEGRPRPSLARDWQVSPDGLSLTVNLTPDVESFRVVCAPVIDKNPDLFVPELVKIARSTPA